MRRSTRTKLLWILQHTKVTGELETIAGLFHSLNPLPLCPPSPCSPLISSLLSSYSVMYVFGGFNSLLLSDVLMYTSPSCSAFSSPASCGQAWPGIQCVWNSTQGTCLPWESSAAGIEQQQLPASCSTRSCRWRRRRNPLPCETDPRWF